MIVNIIKYPKYAENSLGILALIILSSLASITRNRSQIILRAILKMAEIAPPMHRLV